MTQKGTEGDTKRRRETQRDTETHRETERERERERHTHRETERERERDISEVGGENGAERRPPPGNQAQRPRHDTHDTTRQINGRYSFCV